MRNSGPSLYRKQLGFDTQQTLELVFFDAGGGHRSAANALCEVTARQGRPWTMRMMNLQELLDDMDVFRKITGIRMQDLYNLMLRKGWTLGSLQLMKVMHSVIRGYHPSQLALLKKYWREHPSNLVVSLIPNFNRALHESMAEIMPGVPLVTILTDMADFPPHFWIEEDQEQYFICGTERAYRQALGMGHPPSHVFRTSGMILNPRFYDAVPIDRAAERKKLGLREDLPTVLLMFGGEGSPKIESITKDLDESKLDVQVIAIAGRNSRLEAKLREMRTRIPLHVEGFTKEVPKFMQLSDIFIGKPGPGSISEAVAMGLPVIIENNMWTLAQERYNAEWAQESGVGIALESFQSEVVGAVRKMMDPTLRAEYLKNVAAQKNRAVFEIPEILQKIMDQSAGR